MQKQAGQNSAIFTGAEPKTKTRNQKLIPGFLKKFRRRPTLPHSCPCSTIGAEELNFRVRDGNGCCLFAITTEKRLYDTYNLYQDTKPIHWKRSFNRIM